MMPIHLKKIDYHIAIWGLIAIALTAVTGGIAPALSASIGALLGMGNWLVFRRLVKGIATAGNQTGLGLILGLKFMVIMTIISLLFMYTPIKPIPFTVGISGLFLGISSYYFTNLLKDGKAKSRGEN